MTSGIALSHFPDSDTRGSRPPHTAEARALKSVKSLKEGLAQYYTEIVSKRLRADFPAVFETFEDLRARQPKPYQSYRDWIKDANPEEMRFAMIGTRRAGVGNEEDIAERLADIRERLDVQG